MSTSITQAVETFINARRADGRAPRTIQDYRRVLDPFADWCDEQQIGLEALTRSHVREYVAALRERGWSEGTVAIYVRNLRTFLHWLRQEGETNDDLAVAIRPPQTPRRMEDPLTVDEVRALLAACDGGRFASRDRALILTLADTGLRLGELIRLRRSDVCFARDGESAYLLVYAPKTRTCRFVFLSPPSAEALREYLKEADSDGALWSGRLGPLTRSGIREILCRRALQAGLDARRVHPHAFRKFFATSWIRNGGDTLRLQWLGGWASPKMLETYVLLAGKSDLEEAHQQFSPVNRLLR